MRPRINDEKDIPLVIVFYNVDHLFVLRKICLWVNGFIILFFVDFYGVLHIYGV